MPPSLPDTPMMRQYLAIKAEHPGAILLFRMGDFYEMFGEDAEVASRALDIALTTRDKHSAHPVMMCGVPHFSVQGYLAQLVKAGYNVAVCDQVEDPKQAKGIVRREVVRVVTPGTLSEPDLLEAKENNYLAAVLLKKEGIGLAWVDVSTGEFTTAQFDGAKAGTLLEETLSRLEPREILLEEDVEEGKAFDFLRRLAPIHRLDGRRFEFAESGRLVAEQMERASVQELGLDRMPLAVCAAGACLSYLRETQRAVLGHLKHIGLYNPSEFLVIDEISKRNLELLRTARERKRRGSLLGVLDETLTPMGGRKLQQWLLYPLMDVKRITTRLDAVGFFKERLLLRQDLQRRLREVSDLERLSAKVALGTAHARDLAAIGRSLRHLPGLQNLLAEAGEGLPKRLIDRLAPMEDVAGRIEQVLVEAPALALKEGGLIRDGVSAELDELRTIANHGKEYLLDLESRERQATGIPNLKVKYNGVFGYFIEITKSHAGKVPDRYIRKQTLVNNERFITPELKSFEEKVLTAKEKSQALEFALFEELRNEVARETARIKQAADALATLDVFLALAEVAASRNYCRPEVHTGDTLDLKGGRHPVVEALAQGNEFTPNDVHLDHLDHQILLITGPNMAGKSTYIRQVALITLMAQMGSFVPAESASIGLVDRIFTRVGAGDNLVGGESTFLVEMLETAHILRYATPRSLIVLDEIGRGTSTFDGLSLAWATVEYLHEVESVGAWTLFATHYHELTDITITHPRVKNYSVAAREKGDTVLFLHKVVAGKADKSYGIQVALLAGMPRPVIERAKEILRTLEEKELDPAGQPSLSASGTRKRRVKVEEQVFQLSLFTADQDALRARLKQVNPDGLTPLEALQLIHELKRLEGE